MPNYEENVNVATPGTAVVINSANPTFFAQVSSGLAAVNLTTSSYPTDLRNVLLAFNPPANNGVLTFNQMGFGWILTDNSAPLNLGTNNLERVRIDAAGNVGIGTAGSAGPAAKLDVRGSASAPAALLVRNNDWSSGGPNAGSSLLISMSQASGPAAASQLQAYSAGFTAPNPILLNPFGGTVGIGTTAPNQNNKLEVAGVTASNGFFSSGPITTVGLISSNGATQLQLGTNGVASLRIIPGSGNVAIGTTTPNPANKLEVAGTIAATAGGVFSSGMITSGGMITSNGATPLLLGTNGQEKVRITDSGGVAIGTTTPNPANKLEVSGVTASNGFFSSGSITSVGIITSNGHTDLLFGTNGQETVRIADSGNVGLGVPAPAQRLDVLGNIHTTGLVIADGNVNANADVNVEHNLTVKDTATIDNDVWAKSAIKAGPQGRRIADGSGCYYA
jgi:hypothetical protein